MKKFIAIVLTICMSFSMGVSAFAVDLSNDYKIDQEKINIQKSGITYERMPTQHYSDSTDEISSYVTLAGIIADIALAGHVMPGLISICQAIVNEVVIKNIVKIWYKVEVIPTKVYLNGTFSHYEIEVEIWAYANSSYSDLIYHDGYEYESGSPWRIK